ncbi:MAG: hypothetical protein U9N46_05415 [Euryarchaeota archaeon]|nr:hypothetical protein [Euryarchaeota archaeon]
MKERIAFGELSRSIVIACLVLIIVLLTSCMSAATIENEIAVNKDRLFETAYQEPAEPMAPIAYIEICPNPAEEGERVTFTGWGEDVDGAVVKCRWTLPDGSTSSDYGSSSKKTLDSDEVREGLYRFAVMDDCGIWSEEAISKLWIISQSPEPSEAPDVMTIETDPFSHITDPVTMAALAALIVGTLLMNALRTYQIRGKDSSERKGQEGKN